MQHMGIARISCGATCECMPSTLVVDASHAERTSIQATVGLQVRYQSAYGCC